MYQGEKRLLNIYYRLSTLSPVGTGIKFSALDNIISALDNVFSINSLLTLDNKLRSFRH